MTIFQIFIRADFFFNLYTYILTVLVFVFHKRKSFFKNYIYVLLAALGLGCWGRAFSSHGERGLLSSGGVWVSPCRAPLAAERGSRMCAQELGHMA